jgi:hypothetical protein
MRRARWIERPQQVPHAVQFWSLSGKGLDPGGDYSRDKVAEPSVRLLTVGLGRRRAQQLDQEPIDLIITGKLIDESNGLFYFQGGLSNPDPKNNWGICGVEHQRTEDTDILIFGL